MSFFMVLEVQLKYLCHYVEVSLVCARNWTAFITRPGGGVSSPRFVAAVQLFLL